MSFIRPVPWTRQPQLAPRVDWSNPLSRGLIRYWPCNTGGIVKSALSNEDGVLTNGARIAPTSSGLMVAFDGSDDYVSFPSSLLSISNTFTFAAQILITGVIYGTRYTVFGCENAAGAFQLEVGGGAVNTAAGSGRIAAIFSGTSVAETGNGVLTQNKIATIVYQKLGSGSTNAFYVDGVDVGAGGLDSTTNFTDATSIHALGRRSSGSQLFPGYIGNVAIWNRVLTPAEAKSLYAAQWQLFPPITRRIWVPQSGAAPSFLGAWARGSTTIVGSGLPGG